MKIEYFCECGRHFIILDAGVGKMRKCPRCGRMMAPFSEQDKIAAIQEEKNKKKKSSLDNLEDTIEYEYKFDGSGKRVKQESKKSTLGRLLKKIFTLFSVRPYSYKD